VAAQIEARRHSLPLFASGVQRFALGLAKKVIVANWAAACADGVFALPAAELSAPLAWAGLAAYTVQIYFDFSGYSDMAIGLARMFGFRLRENFLWPYVSRSVTEFWRRWHVSLSSWFRDYLYIPLGGNRGGALRTYRNLVVVFLLCGLWHGAAWTFVVWGAFHGTFLVLERLGLGAALARLPRVLQHLYTLAVVMAGWLVFRADSLGQAGTYALALCGQGSGVEAGWRFGSLVGPRAQAALVLGVLGSVPWLPWLARWRAGLATGSVLGRGLDVAGSLALGLLWLVALGFTAADTYNPFIYFRF
jgi:alginate O-acetyltransferase complex protein AlgI